MQVTTLVDTNHHHVLAWSRALARYDLVQPLWRIHRGIGMGGDQIVGHLMGADVEREHGDALRAAWVEEFDPLVAEIRPLEGARSLLAEVKRRGFSVVLASSGKTEHVEALLELFDGRSVADAWTTSDDAEHSKPAPDIVEVALSRVDGARAVMVGDSPWDCIAAGKLEIPTLAVRSGGFSASELEEAGAVRVFDSLVELHENLAGTALARADG